MKDQKVCENCPENDSGAEWYRFMGAFVFDVKLAKQLAAGNEICQVSAENLKKYGLPIEKHDWQTREDGTRFKTISLFGINEEHLAHIPAENMAEPVLFAPL